MTSTATTITSTTLPQSVAPSVAFGIPIEKKELNASPPIQKRLANSPRKEISIDDINQKLTSASQRKDAYLAMEIAKAANHNAQVEKVAVEQSEKTKTLEEHITSKLGNAEAKRDGIQSSWIQRLSSSTKSKLSRGAKVMLDEQQASNELEAKIDEKELSAQLRREEAKLKTQEQLAIATNDKLRRGKLALTKAESEAKHIEERSLQKIEAAELRRERHELGKVDSISAQINSKLQRAADMQRREDEQSIKRLAKVENKITAATQRRDNLLLEQQDTLLQSASKKDKMLDTKQKQEELDTMKRRREMEARLRLAEEKKVEILSNKSEAVRVDQLTKQTKARETWLTSLKQGNELKQTSDKRLKDANERKQQLLKEVIVEKQSANKNKLAKVNQMLEDNGLEETRKALEIEQKISAATANRKQNLIAKASSASASSASKKRMLTPRGSPKSKSEIEEKLVAAQNRREIYLSNKVDKAKSTRVTPKPNIKINKTLFSSVSPSGSASVVSSDDGSAISPRIKAARLEEYQRPETENNEPWSPRLHGYNHMPLIVGGLAVVLVGLLSFFKGK